MNNEEVSPFQVKLIEGVVFVGALLGTAGICAQTYMNTRQQPSVSVPAVMMPCPSLGGIARPCRVKMPPELVQKFGRSTGDRDSAAREGGREGR